MPELQVKVTELIQGMRSKKEILAVLKGAGIEVEDASKESGYMNLRIPVGREYIRIYRTYTGAILVQRFRLEKFQYSGIPVFEPSGRKSF